MSTLRRSSPLLNFLIPIGPGLILGLGLFGCSATSGPRTGAVSKMKTFLAVGDKPLPVVSGEPGSSIAAVTSSEVDAPARRVRPDGRISGRVYDTEGRPVPDARVRLAVSGAPGGKVVSARTDRSGAFTLHGLRPGSDYTVIAEYDGDQGVETGRVDAHTSDTDVKISLGAQLETPVHASTPSRVDRVSDREVVDEPEAGAVVPARDDPPEDRPKRRRPSPVNEEDLPPAPEAEAMAPAASSSTSKASISNRRKSSSGASWRKGSSESTPSDSSGDPSLPPPPETSPRATSSTQTDPAPVDPEAKSTGAPSEEPKTYLDDGVNPLPPALEPIPEKAEVAPVREPDTPRAEQLARRSDKAPDPDLALFDANATSTSTPTRPLAASSAFERSKGMSTTISTSLPAEDSIPGAQVFVPETFAPVVLHPTDPFANARPVAAAPVVTRSKPSVFGSTPKPEPKPEPAESPALTTSPSPEKRRPTWGQVVAQAMPTDPAVTEVADHKVVEPEKPRSLVRRGVGLKSAQPERPAQVVKVASVKPECAYDDRLRRIIDFRLPALDGKPVRFQDLNSDLVLIDFWGTWCPPCVRSIPHLVELQERMGKRLTIVGIACESDAPEVASPKVAETVRKLKVNYPVLLSRNDGSCPLQEALHIGAFPTLILVDREGRVLWRDQGATPATLARLDRMISSAQRSDQTRRY